ncbi:MAG: hypothetical protein AAF234_06580 [Pseudomonadota bacterium]
MRRLRFFKWIIVPALAFAAYQLIGLVHVRWSYTWLDQGQGYSPYAARHYTRCSYWSPGDGFSIHRPAEGRCAWIIFRHPSNREG